MTRGRLSRFATVAVTLCAAAAFLFAMRASAQTETVLYNFSAPPSPINPNYGLIQDASGDFYGVATSGGAFGYGAVFEVTRGRAGGWGERVIYSFNNTGTGGYSPLGGIIMDSAGHIYGTTNQGGARRAGTVFELTRQSNGNWAAKLLYSFGITATDGKSPAGGLVIDLSGNIYGTTISGGSHDHGTVFQLSPGSSGWTETVILSFSGYPRDGGGPSSQLILNSMGALFGTTTTGGGYREGTVFELSPSSGGVWTEEILHAFGRNQKDGSIPTVTVMDSAGNLYGTTISGGPNLFGTVFELTPSADGKWTETILYSFQDNGTDGTSPVSGVIFDSAGDLYGTTTNGGATGNGAVFKLTPDGAGNWSETIMWAFNNTDGSVPQSLTINAAGNLYGETTSGGIDGYGTVYEIVP